MFRQEIGNDLILIFCTWSYTFVFLSFLTVVYTFEVATHLNDFTVPSTSTLELSTSRYKHGAQSLKWTWAKGDAIRHSFPTNVIHLLPCEQSFLRSS